MSVYAIRLHVEKGSEKILEKKVVVVSLSADIVQRAAWMALQVKGGGKAAARQWIDGMPAHPEGY